MSNMKIEDIEGVGAAYAEKLRGIRIRDTDALLERGRTAQGRREIASGAGIGESLILRWVNMADLCRIQGVGPEFAELLEGAGVDTVKELATRNPENLASKLAEVNQQKKLTRRVPNLDVVKGWVEQAQSLPRSVEH